MSPPEPPLFSQLADDATQQQQTQQQQQPNKKQKKKKGKKAQQQVAAAAAAAAAPTAAQVNYALVAVAAPEEPQQSDNVFDTHLRTIKDAAYESREKLHAMLDEILRDGRYALKTTMKELEGTVAEAKQLVDAHLQNEFKHASAEADRAMRAKEKADALAEKLSIARGALAVDGGEGGGEGGEVDGGI